MSQPEDQAAPGSMEIGRALAILRTARGWNQAELAAASGVTRTSISTYERGRQAPDLATLNRLLGAMGVSLSAVDRVRDFVEGLGDETCAAAGKGAPVPQPGFDGGQAVVTPREIEGAVADLDRALTRVVRLGFAMLRSRAARAETVPGPEPAP